MKVLIIDDDPATTEILKILFSPYNHQVVSANTGTEGIDLVKRELPDIVLLDLMMPEMNGWQVCKHIRKLSQVPIIVLSALDNPGMVADALDAGADDYLIKPVPNRVLIARLEKLVYSKRLLFPLTVNVNS